MEKSAYENCAVTINDFAVNNTSDPIHGFDSQGCAVTYVLLTNNCIAMVRAPKMKEAKEARIKAKGDQSKFISFLMTLCVTIEGRSIGIKEVLKEFSFKSYSRIEDVIIESYLKAGFQ